MRFFFQVLAVIAAGCLVHLVEVPVSQLGLPHLQGTSADLILRATDTMVEAAAIASDRERT